MSGKKKSKRAKWKDDDDNDDILDEIDKFNMEEYDLSDSDQFPVKRQKEEVLNVEGDVSDEHDEIENYDIESDFDSLNEEEEGNDLPSFNKWGKKKSQFYDTSYVDGDWGGMNEKEAELAELEEQDATLRQKKLDATFAFLRKEEDNASAGVAPFKEDEEMEDQPMSENEKLDRFSELNPEFSRMVEEYNEKRKIYCEQLALLRDAVDASRTQKKTVLEEQILLAYNVFASYLLNILFYFRMKLTTGLKSDGAKKYLEDHPVIDSIIAQKKMVSRVEDFLTTNKRALKKFLKKYKAGESVGHVLVASDSADNLLEGMKQEKQEANVEEESEQFVEQDVGNEEAEETEYTDENGISGDKRAISSEMQKNKGLSAKRKRGVQHSRIKKRKQYQKALIKKRSQRPDVRREIQPYGGEKRGIRISTVKSVKLKA